MSDGGPLSVAVLHGYTMSATTMEHQLSTLASRLGGGVRFTFLNAPHAVEARPFAGVVPPPPESPRA
eukprot:6187940-Prymnesium_polylepis.1